MWLLFALGGYLALAVVSILDKFIVADRKITPRDFAILSSAPGILVLPAFVLGASFPSRPVLWGSALLAAGAFWLALYTMYRGVEQSEISHLGPLIGGLTPLFVLGLSRVFLRELASAPMLGGIGLLIVGSLAISFEQSRRHNGWHRGLLWGVAAAFSFSVFHVSAKYTYGGAGFASGFLTMVVLLGVIGLISWATLRRAKSSRLSLPGRRRQSLRLVGLDKILGVVGMVLIQYASSLGSVTVVNALAGFQYASLIVLVALLTRFYPRWFRETFGRGELAREVISVAVIFIGLVLVVQAL